MDNLVEAAFTLAQNMMTQLIVKQRKINTALNTEVVLFEYAFFTSLKETFIDDIRTLWHTLR